MQEGRERVKQEEEGWEEEERERDNKNSFISPVQVQQTNDTGESQPKVSNVVVPSMR